jgi:hypothetical protein
LPYLGDVIASQDAQWVYFIAIDRDSCKKECLSMRESILNDMTHIWIFLLSVHVMMDYVHSTK